MSIPRVVLLWRSLGESGLPAVTELARASLSADGGQPFAADPDWLRRTYFSGAETCAGFDGDRLVCMSSLRRAPAGAQGEDAAAVTTGLVHPAWRRRGIGGQAFDWAADQAGPGGVRAETEALGDGAHALYLSRGLVQVLAEDVMQLAASAQLAPVHQPPGLVLSQWGQADPARFHAVYEAAFGDRPGFPGWSPERWTQWISGDEDFRAEWTLLAARAGTDVGFIACDAGGWVSQVGVSPSARGQGIGAKLITEAVQRMRDAGETAITLNVNTDNPHAMALYRRLGFARTGRRARYVTRA